MKPRRRGAELAIDPRGKLTFKTGGRHVLSVAGKVESYGTIQLNARASREAYQALRLVAEKAEDRVLKLEENGALLVHGYQTSSPETRNAVIAAGTLEAKTEQADSADQSAAKDGEAEKKKDAADNADSEEASKPLTGRISAQAKVMVDVQYAQFIGLDLSAEDIDNTGYVANERLNLAHSLFSEGASISAKKCDTPTFTNNRFVYDGKTSAPGTAINLADCKLPQVRNNHIENYNMGVLVDSSTDANIQGNVFAACDTGFYSRYRNVIVHDCEFRKCGVGIAMWKGDGIFEHCIIRDPKVAATNISATYGVSFRDVHVVEAGEKIPHVSFRNSTIETLNCNFTKDTTKLELGAEKAPWIKSWYYLVVQVKGKVPAGAQVMVRTVGADLPAGRKTRTCAIPPRRSVPRE